MHGCCPCHSHIVCAEERYYSWALLERFLGSSLQQSGSLPLQMLGVQSAGTVCNGLREAGTHSRCLFSLSGLSSTAGFLTKPGVSSKAPSGTLFFIVGRKRSPGDATLALVNCSCSADATWGQGGDPYPDRVERPPTGLSLVSGKGQRSPGFCAYPDVCSCLYVS